MQETKKSRVHWSFWLIGAVTLIWNVMGCINFFMQMNSDMVASYRETERAIIHNRPGWATIAFAIAVFGGALGCLLLLLKKSLSFYLFVASLLGVIVTMVHTLGAGIDFSAAELVGIIVMPIVVAAFLVWYAKYAQRKRWVNH